MSQLSYTDGHMLIPQSLHRNSGTEHGRHAVKIWPAAVQNTRKQHISFLSQCRPMDSSVCIYELFFAVL